MPATRLPGELRYGGIGSCRSRRLHTGCLAWDRVEGSDMATTIAESAWID